MSRHITVTALLSAAAILPACEAGAQGREPYGSASGAVAMERRLYERALANTGVSAAATMEIEELRVLVKKTPPTPAEVDILKGLALPPRVTIEKREPGRKFQSAPPAQKAKKEGRPIPAPAWGTPAEVQTCDKAIDRLRAVGAPDHMRATPASVDVIQAEAEYERACLSREHAPQLDKVVGRLVTAQGTFCTATLLAPRRALTALHCLYDLPAAGESRPANPTPALVQRSIKLELGAGTQRVRRGIVAVHVYGDAGAKEWKRIPVEGISAKALTLPPRHDFAIVELDADIAAETPAVLGSATLTANEKLVIYGFYGDMNGAEGPDSGMRSSKAGYCQLLEEKDGCLVHGCPTTGRYSGAPLFVERTAAGGRSQLVFAGVHVDAQGSKSGCKSQWGSIINAGLRVPVISR